MMKGLYCFLSPAAFLTCWFGFPCVLTSGLEEKKNRSGSGPRPAYGGASWVVPPVLWYARTRGVQGQARTVILASGI